MKSNCFILCMFTIIFGSAFAQDQRVIPLSSPVYAQMDAAGSGGTISHYARHDPRKAKRFCLSQYSKG
ncbi:hypothetical protein FACS1894172_04690 [Spirochaetia bacterium]|nr:hypothetical protein FACS1894172_04690 [Spirochaetia bacterium]